MVKEQTTQGVVDKVDNYIKRLFLFLEDKNWKEADSVCEKILDIDSENSTAYLGKLLIDYHLTKVTDLSKLTQDFSENINYKRFVRFGNGEMVNQVNQYLQKIKARNVAKQEQKTIKAENAKKAATHWAKIVAPIVVVVLVLILTINFVIVPNDKYNRAQNLYENGSYEDALQLFESLGNYKDSAEKTREIKKIIESKYYFTYKKIQVQIPSTAEYTASVINNEIHLYGNKLPSMNEFLGYLVAPNGYEFYNDGNPDSIYVTFRIDGFTALDGYGFFQGYGKEYGMLSYASNWPEWIYSVPFRQGETTFIGQYRSKTDKTKTTQFTITVVI